VTTQTETLIQYLTGADASLVIAIVSLLLSSFAVWTSYKKYQIQIDQKGVMETAHKAILVVEDFETTGDELKVFLSNNGNGPIQELRLQCSIEFDGEPLCEPAVETIDITRSDSDRSRQISSLQSDKEREAFSGTVQLSYYNANGNKQTNSFQGAYSDMKSSDIRGAEINIEVVGEDLMGSKESEPVFAEMCYCKTEALPEYPTLEQAIANRGDMQQV
jgi:hypothetical protein